MDVVFNAPDMATLQADAARLGFVDDQGNIIVNGPAAGGGGYFLNIVGTIYQPTGDTTTDLYGNPVPVMAAEPGIWGRLRLNGDSADMPSFSSSITQYIYSPAVGGWTSDGVTLAPSWVGDVALIA
jgi:hypothetical protein